jgi:hypothetical protein
LRESKNCADIDCTNNNLCENMMLIEKAVFDKMMKDKDAEIGFLREQLRKG